MKKNNLDGFAQAFEIKIFPTIKGADGKGIERLEKIVEEKRKEVAERKERKQRIEAI